MAKATKPRNCAERWAGRLRMTAQLLTYAAVGFEIVSFIVDSDKRTQVAQKTKKKVA